MKTQRKVKFKIYQISFWRPPQRELPEELKVFAINRGSAEMFILDRYPEARFRIAAVASTNRPNVFKHLKEYNLKYDNSQISQFYRITPALEW